MINRQDFNDFYSEMEPEKVVMTINDYLAAYDEYIVEIRRNVEKKDFERLKYYSHKLAGVIGFFWDPDSHGAAQRFEQMATDKTEAGLNERYEDLVKKSLLLNKELLEIKKEYLS